MELTQLRYFLQVASSGSFTRAAEELGISQPALSRSIQNLERELGVPVFVRKTREVQLTDAGKALSARARQVLAAIEDTISELRDDGASGTIRVGAIPTIAPYLLPRFLKDFSDGFPQAKLEIYEDTTKDLLHQVSRGDVDVAVLALPISKKYLEVVELFSEELLLAIPAGHRLLERKAIRLSDLEGEPFVMLNEPHCLSETILSFCRQRSFQPVVVGRTNQLATVQELVALSHGISMVPRMASRLDNSESRVYRSLQGKKPARQVAMAWDPYRFQSRLLQSFLDRFRRFCLGECAGDRFDPSPGDPGPASGET